MSDRRARRNAVVSMMVGLAVAGSGVVLLRTAPAWAFPIYMAEVVAGVFVILFSPGRWWD